MKFKCNWCDNILTAPRPHIDAVDQNFKCLSCGGKYKQVLIRQVSAIVDKGE